MKLRIHSVAGKMPDWVEAGVAEYGRGLPRELQPEWRTQPLARRSKSVNTLAVIEQESDRLRLAVKPQEHMVLLDVQGKPWDTPQLAQALQQWQHLGSDISVVIGGPDGVDQALRDRADQRWSLSSLTLPHPLVRVLLAEQLYRAWTIIQGHPYHK
ncbi:MAG: 23S rRNA (pseudouridine(1915)-N(3))-methyltransferase RlmH [Natronospirillum sp.]